MGKITVKHYLNTQLKPEIEDDIKRYPVYISISVNRKFIKRRIKNEYMLSVEEFNSGYDKTTGILAQKKKHLEYEKQLFYRITKLFINEYEKGIVDKDYKYIFYKKGYRSNDEFINLLNSYLDYYSYSTYAVIENYCSKGIEKEIYNILQNTFKFKNKEDVFRFFRYEINTFSNEVDFIYDNLSRKSIELLILKERLRNYLAVSDRETGYDIPYIEFFENTIQHKLEHFFTTYKRPREFYIREGYEINKEMIGRFMKILETAMQPEKYKEFFWENRY